MADAGQDAILVGTLERAKAGEMRAWKVGVVVLAVVLAGGVFYGWWEWMHPGLPDGIAAANGRLEAEQVQVATKFAGRVESVLVEEGDLVKAGTVIARMDAREVRAQLQEAQAQQSAAENQEDEAEAAISARQADRVLAKRELTRIDSLHRHGYASTELFDRARAKMDAAEAAYQAAQASLRQAVSGVDAARATVDRVRTMLDDATLVAPRDGRVQYKLIQSGEVVGAGTAVVTLLDLTDIYMTIFLPAHDAGALALGSEARLVLDPAPQYVIPATVTFVAADAQFTPKTVETADEREKLMFRIKLTIPAALLKTYEDRAKTGVRGIGYVRTKRDAVWPAKLNVKLPPAGDNAGR